MAVTAKAGVLEKKLALLRSLKGRCTPEQIADYEYRLDMSWIHHDAAIEGIVYEPSELLAAINEGVVSDSSLIPVYDEIRQAKAAIEEVRELSRRESLTIDLEILRKLYVTLEPADDDKSGVKYRKDMPLHRQYFHEISQPEKIQPRMKTLVQWLGDSEARKGLNVIQYASKAHYELLQIFPFTKHSGRVARLMMNAILMNADYPPVILHATDRQGYYEALRHGPDRVARVVRAALVNDVNSTIRFFNRTLGLPDVPVN